MRSMENDESGAFRGKGNRKNVIETSKGERFTGVCLQYFNGNDFGTLTTGRSHVTEARLYERIHANRCKLLQNQCYQLDDISRQEPEKWPRFWALKSACTYIGCKLNFWRCWLFIFVHLRQNAGGRTLAEEVAFSKKLTVFFYQFSLRFVRAV